MRSFAAFLLLSAFIFVAPSSRAAAVRAQMAEAADVYAEPNYNSKKVDKVAKGTVVIARTEKKVGAGGMGVFYRIKTPGGKVGYVVDADLVMAGGKIKVVAAPPPPPPKPQPRKIAQPSPVPTHLIDDPEAAKPPPVTKPAPPPPEPVAAPAPPAPEPAKAEQEGPMNPTLWGLQVAIVQYSEKLRGKTWSRSHIFMGARRTAPKADPMAWRSDVGVIFTAGAPRFLSQAGAFGESSGYVLMAEYLWLKPLIVKEKYSLFGAVGPLIAYSTYKTNFDDGPYSRTAIRPGLVLDAGASIKVLRKNYLRADLKVYIEQTFYTAQTVTFQIPF